MSANFPPKIKCFWERMLDMTAKRNILSPLSRPTPLGFLFLKHFIYSVLPITAYL